MKQPTPEELAKETADRQKEGRDVARYVAALQRNQCPVCGSGLTHIHGLGYVCQRCNAIED